MPFTLSDPSEYEASCAVCGAAAEGECAQNCESNRLHIAINRAEAVWLDKWREKTREWVANNAVRYVTSAFAAMKEARIESYKAFIRALPYFNLYEQYHGRPPLHPQVIANLHRQIQTADFELRRNIDSDWKSCVIRYPEVLAFFYSQVSMITPKQPEMPTVLSTSMPRFTIPVRPMSANPTRSTSGASATTATKKQRRKSVTISSTGKPETNEDETMALLSKMLKERNDPYSRPSSKVIGGFGVPQAPEPPPSRTGRNGKRISRDYTTMGMGGIPRIPIATSTVMNDSYRPDGGRFG